MLAGAYGYFMYLPKRKSSRSRRARRRRSTRRTSRLQADVASGQRREAPGRRQRSTSEPQVLQQLVPTSNEVPALLENVSTAARRVGLDLASVEPMPVLTGEQFDTYRYKVSVKGGYHALAGFLTNVGSLNRIVAPVALDLKEASPADKKKASAKDGESSARHRFPDPDLHRALTVVRRRRRGGEKPVTLNKSIALSCATVIAAGAIIVFAANAQTPTRPRRLRSCRLQTQRQPSAVKRSAAVASAARGSSDSRRRGRSADQSRDLQHIRMPVAATRSCR